VLGRYQVCGPFWLVKIKPEPGSISGWMKGPRLIHQFGGTWGIIIRVDLQISYMKLNTSVGWVPSFGRLESSVSITKNRTRIRPDFWNRFQHGIGISFWTRLPIPLMCGTIIGNWNSEYKHEYSGMGWQIMSFSSTTIICITIFQWQSYTLES